MKKVFSEYFPISENDIKELWKKSLIIFDANFLLNIYRYSPNTKKELFTVIKNLSDRLWLTNQACFEFLENRQSVIADQVKLYDDSVKEIEKVKCQFNKNVKNPFIDKEIFEDFICKANQVIDFLKSQSKEYASLLEDDIYLDEISKIFDNKIGKAFTITEIAEIKNEGKKRYEDKIPPGYEDLKKDEKHRYGDLFVWKQIINKAVESKENIIFVTDDLKSDWWEIFQGKSKGPRHELVRELKNNIDIKFHMYSGDMFLFFSNKYLKQRVSIESISEVNNVNLNKIYFDIDNEEINNIRKALLSSNSYDNSIKALQSTFVPYMDSYSKSIKDLHEAMSFSNPMQSFMDSQKALMGAMAFSNPMQSAFDSQKTLIDAMTLANPMQSFIDSQKTLMDAMTLTNPMQSFIDSQKTLMDAISFANPMQSIKDSQQKMLDTITNSDLTKSSIDSERLAKEKVIPEIVDKKNDEKKDKKKDENDESLNIEENGKK